MNRQRGRVEWAGFLLWLVVTLSVSAAPYMAVNGANADYRTLTYYINEPNDSETLYVDFWPNEGSVEQAQVWGNLNRRDRATLGDQDWASVPGPGPESTNYFVGFPMTQAEGGKWWAALPVNKAGAYRLTCRYKVSGDPNWRWAGIRDTAVMVSPKKARDVILYEMMVNVINATGDTEGTRSTFEDLMNPGKPANLDYFENLGVNTLWIQPIHPIGDHECIDKSAGPGSPYSIQNMWEVAPHMSVGNTREASMAAFTNFAAEAGARGIDFFFDIIFNHTSWDAEIGRDPDNPTQPASNPAAQIKDLLPQWYSRYVSSSLPCDGGGYNQDNFHYWVPARHANEIGPAPAERSDFGKWPDVADLFWGTYNALFDPNTDSDSYWDVSQQGADVRRMVEYFAQFGIHWIEKSGGTLGGFRCDYAQGLPPQAWEYFVNKTRQVKWDFLFMAESLDGGNVSKRAGRHMDIINQNWVWQVLENGVDTTGMRMVIDWSKSDYGYAGIMRGLINHDQNAPDNIWYSFSRYAVGAVVDGAPQMYQGQELGYRNGYGFSQFREQYGRYIPHIFKWHNMQELWNNRIGILEDAYRRVNKGRQRNIATRLHDQWYLDRTQGHGPHQQIFSVLKYDTYGWDPAHQNVVLSFVNLTPWTGQSGAFDLASVQAVYLNPTRHYNVKNLTADDPHAYLWAAPGRTGQDLMDNGIFVDMPADGNAYPATAFVQMLKLEEHGGGGGSASIEWVGNTAHTPPNGSIEANSNIVVYIESWPEGTAVSGDVVYTANGGQTWLTEALVWGGSGAGELSQNDWWTANLGQFPACSVIQYAVVLRDGDNNEKWDNNSGQNFFAEVNCGDMTLHHVSHVPVNGAITPDTSITIYAESAPEGDADSGRVSYSVNGGAAQFAAMAKGGVENGRDSWTADIGTFPACASVVYAVGVSNAVEQIWSVPQTARVECVGLIITNPVTDISVGNATDTYTVQGTLFGNFTGDLQWTNTATGGAGTAPAVPAWSIADIPLATGANPIIVSGFYTNPGGGTAVVAWDSPTNASYDAGWNDGSGGGSGFGNWTLTAGANAGHFRATLADGTNMSVGSVGWGMWAHTDSAADAIRSFSNALEIGDSFNLRWDNNWVHDDPEGSVGFSLLNASDTPRFEFMFIGGGTNYVINDSASSRHTGIPWTGDGLEMVFTLTGADAYQLKVGSWTISGTLDHAATAITQFKSWNWRAGFDWPYNLYLGEMSVTRSVPSTNVLQDSVTITRLIGYDEFGDDDADGIPNWWEDTHFGGPTNAVATNLAANAVNTLLETYIAGLDPHDVNAFVTVRTMDIPVVGLQVSWTSVAGRVYNLHRAANLMADEHSGFTSLVTGIPADPPRNIYHDETATDDIPYFYRVAVELE